MKTLLLSFLFFGIHLVLAQTTQETQQTSTSWTPDVGACAQQVMCQFLGDINIHGYQFSIDDMQSLQRCNAVMYGQYWMDRTGTGAENESAPQVLESDKNAIISLTQIGVPVYILAGYMNDTESKWAELLCPTDPTYLVKQKAMLLEFLNEYKITGVIFDFMYILYTYNITTTENIVTFISAFKNEMPTLKIGFNINGQDYAYFTDSEAFNYDEANKLVDLYLVDMTESNLCSEGTKNSSVNPIGSTHPYLYTIEQQCMSISQSSMDKLKTVAVLQVFTTESVEDAAFYEDTSTTGSYTELCQEIVGGNSTQRWCFDSTMMLYNQGKFVTDYVCNIMLKEMETDDYQGACGCQKFVVTNTIIDGWQTLEQLGCDTIDQQKSEELTVDLQTV